MTNSNGLKFFIFVPAKLGRLEKAAKYQHAMKCCPSCGGKLVLFHEKFGELNGEFRARLGSTGSSSGRGSGGEPRPWNPPGSKETQSGAHGGWYCSTCGVHIMAELKPPVSSSRSAKHASRSMEDLKNAPKTNISRRVGWSFPSELFNINVARAEHFMLKEAQLKEYQVDLCQRERILRANEEYMDQRYSNLRSAEQVVADKTERLHMYKESMLSHLEGRATQLSRYETSLREWREQMIREMDPSRQPAGAATNPEYMDHRTLYHQANNYQDEVDAAQGRDPKESQEPYKTRAYSHISDQTDVRKSYRQSWHNQQEARLRADSTNNSRTDVNGQPLAAKPPISGQRFGPIYQYRTTSRAQLPGAVHGRQSSTERRSWGRTSLSDPKDDNNNAMDSPSSKTTADRDSGYTSTSLSMNRSDSPDRLNNSALPQSSLLNQRRSLNTSERSQSHADGQQRDVSGTEAPKGHPGDQRRSINPELPQDGQRRSLPSAETPQGHQISNVGHSGQLSGDADKTKPLRVYTTGMVRPDERPVTFPPRTDDRSGSYPSQSEHPQTNYPPHTQGTHHSQGPVYYNEQPKNAPPPGGATDQYRRGETNPTSPRSYMTAPRTWLEGPRRVTEL